MSAIVDWVMNLLRQVLTEERTDEFIDWIFLKIKLPLWLAWATPIVKKALDDLVPEKLLDAIEQLLRKYLDKEVLAAVGPPPKV